MTAIAWQSLGFVLIAVGVMLLGVSQFLLARWHKRMLDEL